MIKCGLGFFPVQLHRAGFYKKVLSKKVRAHIALIFVTKYTLSNLLIAVLYNQHLD